jgi:hypothetical protein
MRLVHLSDLHLGYRQYQRLTPSGINQREWDVANAFHRAVERIIDIRPDVVLVAGDVFHNVRPTNSAILKTFSEFSRLRGALPDARVIIVAGNHDLPRTREMGGILRLFAELGVSVVDGGAERLHFPELDLSVLCVPDMPGAKPALVPDPDARFNVLMLHGEVEGVLPRGAAAIDRASMEVTTEELGAARWSYVALGHYHVYRQVAPNAFYSGSIEYTSANMWGELVEERQSGISGKGLIERDLETGMHVFHDIPSARALVDLPRIAGRGMSAADLDAAIAERVARCEGGIDDKIVRIVARDVPRHIARDLDHKALREYKRRALHFHLDARRPELLRLHASGSPGRRPSLVETVQEKLRSRVLESDIDRDALVALAIRYLDEATAITAAPSLLADGVGAPMPSADVGGAPYGIEHGSSLFAPDDNGGSRLTRDG